MAEGSSMPVFIPSSGFIFEVLRASTRRCRAIKDELLLQLGNLIRYGLRIVYGFEYVLDTMTVMLGPYRLQLDFEPLPKGEIQLSRTKFADGTHKKEARAGADGFRWTKGTKAMCWLLLRYKLGELNPENKALAESVSSDDGECVTTLINCVKKKQESWAQHIFQINHEVNDNLNLVLCQNKAGKCWLSADLAPTDIAFKLSGAELDTVDAIRDLMEQVAQQIRPRPRNNEPLQWTFKNTQSVCEEFESGPTDNSEPVFVIPYVARGVIGRDQDIQHIVRQLNPGPKLGPDSDQGLLVVYGVPGVGKTTLTQVLARDERVREHFPHGILWGAADSNTAHESILTGWYRAVSGSENCPSNPNDLNTALCGILQHRRILIIIDDLWKSNELMPLLVGGALARTLVTTRLPQVATELAAQTESRYELRPLHIDDAMALLHIASDGVVDDTSEGVRKLANALEGLPLLLHVAGRFIQRAKLLGQDINELIAGLTDDLSRLLEENPPGMSQRTVEAVVRRSTDRLTDEQRFYFSLLGTIGSKPASFDSDILRTAWDCSDPISILGALVDLGLVQVVDENRYQMHALISEYAKSLLPR